MGTKKLFKSSQFYHVFNKSIANYGIFKDDNNKIRFLITLGYYNSPEPKPSLSVFLRTNRDYSPNLLLPNNNTIIKFLCYCTMPDHYHLLVKINTDGLFSKYINDVENSYTRYFNTRFQRKGPLWQSVFKAVRIRTNEQLLHVSRYIHINPTTNYLVEKPEDWFYSSYREYINNKRVLREFINEISISSPQSYKKFVENQIDYQRKLKKIKRLLLE